MTLWALQAQAGQSGISPDPGATLLSALVAGITGLATAVVMQYRENRKKDEQLIAMATQSASNIARFSEAMDRMSEYLKAVQDELRRQSRN